jgi:elongator complex protein 1
LFVQKLRTSSHSITDTLMLTPLKLANIPPPMSLYEVKLRMTPIDVAINQSGTVIAVLQHNGIDLIDWGIKPARSPVVNNNVISIEAPLSFSQLIFVGERSIFLLGENRNGGSVLRWLSLGTSGDIQKDETISIDMKSPCAISEVPGSTQTTILCQTEAGEVFEYALSDKSKRLVCKFSTPCPWMDAAVMGEQVR